MPSNRKIIRIAIDRKLARKIMWQSYGLFLAAAVFINVYIALFHFGEHGSRSAILDLLILTAPLTLIVHELLHGLALKIFGGKVRFQVRLTFRFLPYLYTDAPNQSFTFWQMMIAGLLPFILLNVSFLVSIALYPATILYAMVGFLLNVSGSAADLYIIRAMVRNRSKTARILFKDGGFDLIA